MANNNENEKKNADFPSSFPSIKMASTVIITAEVDEQ